MSVTFEWHGVTEMIAALKSLPSDLANETSPIALQQAKNAESAIRAAWGPHVYSGDMENALRVEVAKGAYAGPTARGAAVVDASPHALWFEEGTAARHTRRGYERGAMRPAHVFIPAMERARAAFYDDVAVLLKDHGLEVRR